MKVTDVITTEQLKLLREAGYVVIHREPTESMIGAMLSTRVGKNTPCNLDLDKSFHRLVAESIRLQNLEV